MKGIEYVDIININDPERSEGWFPINDGAIFTYWGYQWVEYEVDLTEGNWNIGLNVINRGYIDTDDWYNQFEILQSFTDEAIVISSSDTEANYGYINMDITSSSVYTVRFTWMNDKCEPPQDANVQINGIFLMIHQQLRFLNRLR
ncbi:hypothetical protein QUF75_10375 [Desulfococcaceae bacterium HSG7]|nr:hypothetical protein [Desulfococcaceae bacterium HSG7]